MGMDDIEAPSLAVKIVGIPGLELFFEIERRVRIILTRHWKDRLDRAVDLGVSGSEELHLMASSRKVPATSSLASPAGSRLMS